MSDQDVTINGVSYLKESITERGVQLINAVNKIDQFIKMKDEELKVFQISRGTVFNDLLRETENFVKQTEESVE